jgi:hypothetical protein
MEDSNILHHANIISQGICIKKDCDNEIKQLLILINKHNEYCLQNRMYYNEYEYNTSNKTLSHNEVINKYETTTNSLGFLSIEEKFNRKYR